MEIKQLTIFDVSENVPSNPNYNHKPLRQSPITHIIWHSCHRDIPSNHIDLVNRDLRSNYLSSKGCPVPTFSYYIERSGAIFKLVEENLRTWHVGVPKKYQGESPFWNDLCLGIGFETNLKQPLSNEVYNLGLLLTAEISARRMLPVENVLGHRELSGTGHVPGYPTHYRTKCPGIYTDMRLVRSRVANLRSEISLGLVSIQRDDIPTESSFILIEPRSPESLKD